MCSKLLLLVSVLQLKMTSDEELAVKRHWDSAMLDPMRTERRDDVSRRRFICYTRIQPCMPHVLRSVERDLSRDKACALRSLCGLEAGAGG